MTFTQRIQTSRLNDFRKSDVVDPMDKTCTKTEHTYAGLLNIVDCYGSKEGPAQDNQNF